MSILSSSNFNSTVVQHAIGNSASAFIGGALGSVTILYYGHKKLKSMISSIFPSSDAQFLNQKKIIPFYQTQLSQKVTSLFSYFFSSKSQQKSILIPSNLIWWEETKQFKQEKEKVCDFIAFIGVLAIFQTRYGNTSTTQTEFYKQLLTAKDKPSSIKKEILLKFLKTERKKLENAWTPWIIDYYLFESLYIIIKNIVSYLSTSTIFFKNFQKHLEQSPIQSTSHLLDKIHRYFKYLNGKYKSWSQDNYSTYVYNNPIDEFLKRKLYIRQNQNKGNFNLDFFFEPYNLVKYFEKNLFNWACKPYFTHDHPLAFLNSSLLLVTQLMIFIPRFLLQLFKLPAMGCQWMLNTILFKIAEQILINTSLLEKIDEICMQAILYPSPYQFALLEILIDMLEDILKNILPTMNHQQFVKKQNEIAKHDVKQKIINIVYEIIDFSTQMAKDNLSQPDQVVINWIRRYIEACTDNPFDTFLHIISNYPSPSSRPSKQIKTRFLSALNFHLYNKSQHPSDQIKQQHQKCLEKLTDVALRILQKSFFHQSFYSQSYASSSYLMPAILPFIDETKKHVIHNLSKGYIMKGLILFLLSKED